MDLKRKIEIATMAVKSISGHSDEDAEVINAALVKVISIVEKERAALQVRVDARVAAALSGS